MLQRVTITGADDLTAIDSLLDLSAEFPFVEWGILLSSMQEGMPRFPSTKWINKLVEKREAENISLHVCGRWVKQMLIGENPVFDRLPGLWIIANRVQLNFHGERHDKSDIGLVNLIRGSFPKEFIFQMDGTQNEALFHYAENNASNVAPLFDISGGAGLLPEEWPAATGWAGYAGGLSPDNISEQYLKILGASKNNKFWIDMERRVRTDQMVGMRDALDIGKVRRVLEFAKGIIDQG